MNLTWDDGAETTVTADAAINSDAISLSGDVGFSLIAMVTGGSPSGISGNLCIEVTNDPTGLTGWVELVGSTQSVRLMNGGTQTFQWSYFGQLFLWARLSWVQAGMQDSGTLGTGLWNVVVQPANAAPIPMPVLPTILPANAGVVQLATDRLAQYLKGLPTNPSTGV
jgi:hypothetical protein